MIVDSHSPQGRLYMSGLVGGSQQIVALAATDGQLLTAYGVSGEFAVDGVHGWLYVDRDESGLAVLDAQTGVVQTTIPLPPNQDEWRQTNPAPQADPASGQVLAFRDNVVYVVDPNQGAVVDTLSFDVPQEDRCRSLDGPLPIVGTTYDSARRFLYLDFVTYQCTPWIHHTLVLYDLNAGTEIIRRGTSPFKATASDGYLYGSSWYRMGVGYRWAWQDGEPWFTSEGWADWSSLFVDAARKRLYETSAGGLKVFDAETMTLLMNVPRPVEGDLVGYDPQTDQLYFLADGKLHRWPASAIQPPTPEPLLASDPPARPVGRLLVSPAWPRDKALFGLWDHDLAPDDCFVFGVTGGLLYLSSDGGSTWGQPHGGLRGGCRRMSALAVSPDYATDRTILASIMGTGIFKSTDGGRLWLPSSIGLLDRNASHLLFSPGFGRDQTVFARTSSAGMGRGTLYRSTDGGTSWQLLDIALRSVAMSPEFDQDQTLVGVSYEEDAQVFLSRDGGDTWEHVGGAPGGGGVNMLSLAPLFEKWQVVFAHDDGTLYRSGNGGRRWEAVLQAGETAAPGLFPPQLVYGPETEGGRLLFLLVTTRDYGADPALDRGTLYRSNDGGRAWQVVELPAGILPTALDISPNFAQDGLLFVGTANGQVVAVEAAALAEE